MMTTNNHEKPMTVNWKHGDCMRVDNLVLRVGNPKHGPDDKSALYGASNAIHGWDILSEPGVVVTRLSPEPTLSDEELDRARSAEALRQLEAAGKCWISDDRATIAARLARENWRPPPPVDEAVRVCREDVAKVWEGANMAFEAARTRRGECDNDVAMRAYRAGKAAS